MVQRSEKASPEAESSQPSAIRSRTETYRAHACCPGGTSSCTRASTCTRARTRGPASSRHCTTVSRSRTSVCSSRTSRGTGRSRVGSSVCSTSAGPRTEAVTKVEAIEQAVQTGAETESVAKAQATAKSKARVTPDTEAVERKAAVAVQVGATEAAQVAQVAEVPKPIV